MFNVLTLNMEFISQTRQDFLTWFVMQITSENLQKDQSQSWNIFHIQCNKLNIVSVHNIFFGFWTCLILISNLGAVCTKHNVTSHSLACFTLWKITFLTFSQCKDNSIWSQWIIPSMSRLKTLWTKPFFSIPIIRTLDHIRFIFRQYWLNKYDSK